MTLQRKKDITKRWSKGERIWRTSLEMKMQYKLQGFIETAELYRNVRDPIFSSLSENMYKLYMFAKMYESDVLNYGLEN